MNFAIKEARETHRPLYLLFVRAVPILSESDYKRKWQEDEEARAIFIEIGAGFGRDTSGTVA